MNDEFTRQAVAQSLKKMFSGGHFNICAIDAGLKALNLTPHREQYDSLRPLHCVDWADMDPEFRQMVFKRVMALFADSTAFDLVEIDRAMGVPITAAIRDASDGPEKRRAAGLLPFQRRA